MYARMTHACPGFISTWVDQVNDWRGDLKYHEIQKRKNHYILSLIPKIGQILQR